MHDPEVLYLDEPTIGLDVVAKSAIRDFIKEINKERKTTVILTTHDMADIEYMCERLIMINKGRIVYDGSLQVFKDTYGGDYVLDVDFADPDTIIKDKRLKVIGEEGPRKTISCSKDEIVKRLYHDQSEG